MEMRDLMLLFIMNLPGLLTCEMKAGTLICMKILCCGLHPVVPLSGTFSNPCPLVSWHSLTVVTVLLSLGVGWGDNPTAAELHVFQSAVRYGNIDA
jgi:hypothetical protein